jgi:hypothetical protein
VAGDEADVSWEGKEWRGAVENEGGAEAKYYESKVCAASKRALGGELIGRSFFGEQEGEFELEVEAIEAVAVAEDLEAGLSRQNVRRGAVAKL